MKIYLLMKDEHHSWPAGVYQHKEDAKKAAQLGSFYYIYEVTVGQSLEYPADYPEWKKECDSNEWVRFRY